METDSKRIFVASSQQAIEHARDVAVMLEEHGASPLPWYEPEVFIPGQYTLARLVQLASTLDGALIIFGEDDQVWYQGDARLQPRDNVLIEYGLFASAVGIGSTIICRYGSAKVASDLSGLTYLHLADRHRCRRALGLWLDELGTPTEVNSVENIRMRRDLEETQQRLEFERAKSRDLEELLADSGFALPQDQSWTLLFDYDFFWRFVALLVEQHPTPRAWHDALPEEVSRELAWGQMENVTHTRTLVAKALRLVRRKRFVAALAMLADGLDADRRHSLELLLGNDEHH